MLLLFLLLFGNGVGLDSCLIRERFDDKIEQSHVISFKQKVEESERETYKVHPPTTQPATHDVEVNFSKQSHTRLLSSWE